MTPLAAGCVACENMSRLGGPNGLNPKEKQGGMGAVRVKYAAARAEAHEAVRVLLQARVFGEAYTHAGANGEAVRGCSRSDATSEALDGIPEPGKAMRRQGLGQ